MSTRTPTEITRRNVIAAAATLSLTTGPSPQAHAAWPRTRGAPRDTDVVVVGAGLSGLCAALRLRQAGLDVVVIEGKQRVGGRTHRLRLGAGQTTEGGGQWIAPSHERIHALIDELGLETFKTYNDGRSIYYRDGRRTLFTGTIPPLRSTLGLADLAQAQARLEAMAATVPTGRPWDAPNAHAWDRTTFGAWLDENMVDPEARWLIGLAFSLVTCQDPHATSLLYMLNFFNTSGGFEEPISVEGGAQDSRVVGGTWLIAKKLAEKLPVGDLVLDSPVSEIRDWDSGRLTVVSRRGTFRCRQVVVAMSPTDASRIQFTPRLPSRRTLLQRNGGSGSMHKLFMVYDEPFWRGGMDGGEPLNGQVISDLMMTPYVCDNSPADGSRGVLVTFMVEDSGVVDPYLTWSDDVVSDRTLRARRLGEDLSTVFGDDRFTRGRYAEKSWSDERWIDGCVNMTAPGSLTGYTNALTMPVGRIHWAGSDTSIDDHPSYMEGAVRTGERAAAAVVGRLGKRG